MRDQNKTTDAQKPVQEPEVPQNQDVPRQAVSIFRLHDKYVPEFEIKFSPSDKTSIALEAVEGLEGRFFPIAGESLPPNWLSAVESLLPFNAEVKLVSHPR